MSAAVQRKKKGKPRGRPFPKGASPNPGGVSKERRAFIERLRGDDGGADAEDIYAAFMALVREGNMPAVLRAMEYLIGKPREQVGLEVTGKDGGPVDVKEVVHAVPDAGRLERIFAVLVRAGALSAGGVVGGGEAPGDGVDAAGADGDATGVSVAGLP